MRYFRQIDKFGVSDASKGWFVSLLDRLGELGSYDVDEFLSDFQRKGDLRYHAIDWHVKNVPICRSDLDWLPTDYLNNDTEYPLVQFMISKATGRVVGFWDEENVFQIVLLDPKHNIQPSKFFGYRVDPCFPVASEFEQLKRRLMSALKSIESNPCECANVVRKEVESQSPSPNVFEIVLSDQELNDVLKALEKNQGKTFDTLFWEGVFANL